MISVDNSSEKVGRGKRIRTSGPCLPKIVPPPQTRRKPCFCLAGALEQIMNIAGFLPQNTGATPERNFKHLGSGSR
jgi:hypothetical protein